MIFCYIYKINGHLEENFEVIVDKWICVSSVCEPQAGSQVPTQVRESITYWTQRAARGYTQQKHK